jgi:hypothetical protein
VRSNPRFRQSDLRLAICLRWAHDRPQSRDTLKIPRDINSRPAPETATVAPQVIGGTPCNKRRVQSHEVDHQTWEVIGADGAHDGALRDTWQEASKAWTPLREIPSDGAAPTYVEFTCFSHLIWCRTAGRMSDGPHGPHPC